jgi:hypothetical protein
MSVVEQKLREDPGRVYGNMDFLTRDRYRHAVEKLAKESLLSEAEVARRAIQLAHESATSNDAEPRTSHVGFYLIDAGRPLLERAVNAHRSIVALLTRLASRFPSFLYLGAIWMLTGLFTAGMVAMAHAHALSVATLVVVAIISLLATSHLAVGLVNWLLTLLVTPHPLPRMDCSSGIAPESRTLVVVPAMLTNARGIEDLVEALEVRFLANQDVNLRFALLTDFLDASEETMPEDTDLLQLVRAKIGALNEKYGAAGATAAQARPGEVFYLFHRPASGTRASGSGWVTSASGGSLAT